MSNTREQATGVLMNRKVINGRYDGMTYPSRIEAEGIVDALITAGFIHEDEDEDAGDAPDEISIRIDDAYLRGSDSMQPRIEAAIKMLHYDGQTNNDRTALKFLQNGVAPDGFSRAAVSTSTESEK